MIWISTWIHDMVYDVDFWSMDLSHGSSIWTHDMDRCIWVCDVELWHGAMIRISGVDLRYGSMMRIYEMDLWCGSIIWIYDVHPWHMDLCCAFMIWIYDMAVRCGSWAYSVDRWCGSMTQVWIDDMDQRRGSMILISDTGLWCGCITLYFRPIHGAQSISHLHTFIINVKLSYLLWFASYQKVFKMPTVLDFLPLGPQNINLWSISWSA